ncbi:unnamed protein product, partial [Nesidiocoris tenuis]
MVRYGPILSSAFSQYCPIRPVENGQTVSNIVRCYVVLILFHIMEHIGQVVTMLNKTF